MHYNAKNIWMKSDLQNTNLLKVFPKSIKIMVTITAYVADDIKLKQISKRPLWLTWREKNYPPFYGQWKCDVVQIKKERTQNGSGLTSSFSFCAFLSNAAPLWDVEHCLYHVPVAWTTNTQCSPDTGEETSSFSSFCPPDFTVQSLFTATASFRAKQAWVQVRYRVLSIFINKHRVEG